MTLTMVAGPFGPHGRGEFNFEARPDGHVLFFEHSPRRIRAAFGGETLVDTRRGKLMHETGHVPVYYFPLEDVRTDLLRPTDHATHCPFKGDASYWSIQAGGREAENAVWGYPEPLPDAPGLAGYVAFYFDRLDHFFEEDEEVFGHPRDPYHRIDVLRTSAHVRVLLGGRVLADTRRAQALYETGLPTRYYVPEADVALDALEPVEGLRTRCAYKGLADEWYAAEGGGERVEAAAWVYRDPRPEAIAVKDHLAFFNERLDIEVDGQVLERLPTPWSSDDWIARARERSPSVR